MKSKPLLVTALVGFWIGYVVISIYFYWSAMSEMVAKDNQRRLRHIDYQVYLASPLLATHEIEAFVENMSESNSMKEYDFYLLKDGDKIVSFYNPEFSLEETVRKEFPLGSWQSSDGQTKGRTVQVGDYTFVIGINSRGAEHMLRTWNYQKWGFLWDILIVSGFFLIFIYLVLKDILDLTKILRLKNRDQSQLVKVRTQEAEVLLAVTSQYEQMSKSLKLSNKSYAESLSPAIRHELSERTPVPHLFDAVVVRIDVNGYTQMFLEKKDEFVTATLNTYFQRAAEVIHRYGGHIYQFVGDEIVFHFKSIDHAEPLLMALSCVRSLFEVAEDMDQELNPKGVPFVVKGAIARGRMRFIRLDTGYAFAGLPLIESVRMLGKIDERDSNIVALYAEDLEGMEEWAVPFKRMTVAFKGFGKQTEIVEIKEFKKIETVLQKTEKNQLQVWRSDRDLTCILSYLRQNLQDLEKDRFVAIYKALRGFEVGHANGQVSAEYTELLKAAQTFAEKESYDEQSAFASRSQTQEMAALILASVINLGSQLLRAGVLNEEVRQIMEKNLQHSDQRIRGNSILALDELAPESYSFREMFSLPFNRAAADALIAEGRREYTAEVHKFLKSFLKSADAFFVASGLYVLAYLYDYHREMDSIYFAANGELQEIPALLHSMRHHRDPMVQRRLAMSESLVSGQKAS